MNTFIKYQKYVICKNCKHYVPPTQHDKGRCNVFGEKNLETGEIIFMDSLTCRKDLVIGENIPFMKTCGISGTYFEEKSI